MNNISREISSLKDTEEQLRSVQKFIQERIEEVQKKIRKIEDSCVHNFYRVYNRYGDYYVCTGCGKTADIGDTCLREFFNRKPSAATTFYVASTEELKKWEIG